MKVVKKTLRELAEKIGAKIVGDADCEISGIATIQSAKPGQLTFLHSPQYQRYLSTTDASAIIVSKDCSDVCQSNLLIVDDPYYAYALVAKEFETIKQLPVGVHKTAVIGENCQIDTSASIGAYVVIGDNVTVGANTQIHPGSVVGDDSQIGCDCLFWANSTLYFNVQVGDRVILHSGSVIGADGFGLAPHKGTWHKIPQLGRVILHDDVEVGASTTIDRGALEDTIICKGVKLDNQIQVGHNAKIGEHSILAGASGVSGSTTIGKRCMFGANAGVGGHITIADDVILGGRAMVTKSVGPGVYASGTGHFKIQDWRKIVVRLRHLDDMARRLKKLEEKFEEEK